MKLRWTLFASAGLAAIVSISLLAAPIGCGDDDGGGSNSLTLAEYCSQSITVFCKKRVECWSAAALAYEGYATEAECVAAFESENTCGPLVAGWQDSIDNGRLQFSGPNAKTCISTLTGATCEQFEDENANPFSQCSGVLTPKVAQSGTCKFPGIECSTGLWCKPKGYTGDPTTLTCDSGTCTPLKKQGESCTVTAGDVCELGTTCIPVVGTGSCTAKSDVGGSCSPAGCKTGLKCGDDNTCMATVRIGEACDDSNGDPCDGYSYCDSGTCTGLPKVGETCGGALPTTKCWLGWCDDSSGTGVCAALPKLGESCSDETTTTCGEGRCDKDPTDPKCVAFKALGQACTSNGECESLVCHPTNNECVEQYCP